MRHDRARCLNQPSRVRVRAAALSTPSNLVAHQDRSRRLLAGLVSAWWFLWLPNWRPPLREGERYGIDVSAHQGTIDWERVARDGIMFAYVKPEGCTYSDRGSDHGFPSGSVRLVRNPGAVPMMADGSLLRSGGETWGRCRPNNVHETGVWLNKPGFPIVPANAQQVKRTRTKTCSRAES
jgi:hypothetical protein